MASPFSFSFPSEKVSQPNLWKILLLSSFALYLLFTFSLPKVTYPSFPSTQLFSLFTNPNPSPNPKPNPNLNPNPNPNLNLNVNINPNLNSNPNPNPKQPVQTNLSHLLFGIVGSEGGTHFRKHYIESWWRPNSTRGILYLDVAPYGELLPWSPKSPPFRVSDNITELVMMTRAAAPMAVRIVRALKELLRDYNNSAGEVRWVVMGDYDSIFFLDNLVDVLGGYDHNKYYYIGAPSEFYMSNVWFSFEQGFGGAGIVLSYPLAKLVADDMENCLFRHAPFFITADIIYKHCVGDFGVDLTVEKGLHQIDFRGDIWGLLSAHPKSPLLSLHHLDSVYPLFPGMDRLAALRYLMASAAADESRTLQQTVCHERQMQWTISVSWGYSAQIYERVMPRSHLTTPLETFATWIPSKRPPPWYMFNTRSPGGDPCEAPHPFFLTDLNVSADGTSITTTYSRADPRTMNPCLWCADHCPDFITEIRVHSPAAPRRGKNRIECCDVVGVNGTTAVVNYRECGSNEFIA